MSARGHSSRRDFSPLALPSPPPGSLGRTHILLGIFFCPGGLPVVTEFGCTVQHAWGSLPKVADQIKLLLGFIPRNNCRREDPVIGSRLGLPTSLPQKLQARGGGGGTAHAKMFSGSLLNFTHAFASRSCSSVGRVQGLACTGPSIGKADAGVVGEGVGWGACLARIGCWVQCWAGNGLNSQPCWFYSVQISTSLSSRTYVIGSGNATQRPAPYLGRESRVRRWKVGK